MGDQCIHHSDHIKELTQLREMTNTNAQHIENNTIELKEVRKTHEILIILQKDIESINSKIENVANSKMTMKEHFCVGVINALAIGLVGMVFWLIVAYGNEGGLV